MPKTIKPEEINPNKIYCILPTFINKFDNSFNLFSTTRIFILGKRTPDIAVDRFLYTWLNIEATEYIAIAEVPIYLPIIILSVSQ